MCIDNGFDKNTLKGDYEARYMCLYIVSKLTGIAEFTQRLDVAVTGVRLDRRRYVTKTDSLCAEVIRLRERLQQYLNCIIRPSFLPHTSLCDIAEKSSCRDCQFWPKYKVSFDSACYQCTRSQYPLRMSSVL